tara:strand:+ start:163 stop:639 length:477 start_codon:yes stop_codon:yes gene_type:complete
MKKLLLLASLFFVLSCTKGEDGLENNSVAFLTKFDGKGFVYSGEISDTYIFFYDSDIFLKEVEVYYPDLDTYCDTVKRGSNTDDGYNFSAEILNNDPKELYIKISYTDDEGNAISSNYIYREVCNTPSCPELSVRVTQDDGSVKTYSETSIKHSSLCN